MTNTERPKWVKDKTLAEDFEVINCKSYDDYKDHKNDDSCYVLIKVDFEFYEIQVAISNYEHKILKVFKGKRPQDIYTAIFEYEKEHNLNWFSEKQHIAYLGKELKKAEIALALGNNGYYQE
ncbi:MAG: hypothetical protein COU64_06440 [Candidatus Pacebacteria bacterium CG10_big_fil_rev_8_21_14_0_10_40_26]|nr:MAG: hypothetical protein COU64_06440 [Candidatus Pacebacteria bacterium CG10_big_fil_rev_8_21_14_0_10_40_26]